MTAKNKRILLNWVEYYHLWYERLFDRDPQVALISDLLKDVAHPLSQFSLLIPDILSALVCCVP